MPGVINNRCRGLCNVVALVLTGLGTLVALETGRAGEASDRPVTLILHERSIVSRHTVQVGDIATIDGGTEAERRRIAAIDIDELPPDGHLQTIRRNQIQYRLRLEGIVGDAYRITGALEAQVVAQRQPISAEKVVEAARHALFGHLSWPRDELQVELAQAVTIALPGVADGETLAIVAEPYRGAATLGRVQMNVTIQINGQKRLALPVYFTVGLLQDIAVCRRALAKGEHITETDIVQVRRPVGRGETQLVRAEALIGKKARRDLPAGQPLHTYDIEAAPGFGADRGVRAGDIVEMTVAAGALKVVARGEALKGGVVGDTITVRNIDSKKVITGIITGTRTVTVDIAPGMGAKP